MRRKKVTNDTQRLTHLRTIATMAGETGATGELLLAAPLSEEAAELAASLAAATTSYNALSHAVRKARAARRAHLDRLIPLTRAFLAVLKQRIRIGRLPAPVMTLFDLPQSGTRRRPNDQRHWKASAKALIEGDIAAEAAGFPRMVEPAREELVAILTALAPIERTIETEELALIAAQRALTAQRERAMDLLTRVGRYLGFSLSGENPEKRRRIMRVYGYAFVGDPTATDEGSQANAAEATATAAPESDN